jgi:hypothetical protein
VIDAFSDEPAVRRTMEDGYAAHWLKETEKECGAWLSRIREALLDAGKRPVHLNGKGYEVALCDPKLQTKSERWSGYDRVQAMLALADVHRLEKETGGALPVTAPPDATFPLIANEARVYAQQLDDTAREAAERDGALSFGSLARECRGQAR